MNYVISHLEMFGMGMDLFGLRELPGEENNPIIMQFFREIGHNYVQGDETAWCSAFINYIAKVNGYEYSGALNARSWLKTGTEVMIPNVGDVVVLWRESKDSWKGHVGLYVNQVGSYVNVLGGNQNNSVNISVYPLSRVLGYRVLIKK